MTSLATAVRDAKACRKLHGERVRTLAGLEARSARDDAAAAATRATCEALALRCGVAEDSLGQEQKEILRRYDDLVLAVKDSERAVKDIAAERIKHAGVKARAAAALEKVAEERATAQAARDDALNSWWVEVDAGLAAARGVLPAASRVFTQALEQAQWVRREVNPRGWADLRDDTGAKQDRVAVAYRTMIGTRFHELMRVLEAHGGRTVTLDEDAQPLPEVLILVDGHGTMLPPHIAVQRLAEQYDDLSRTHDEKLNEAVADLLSSTFLEHLTDRYGDVVRLLAKVNAVLALHPTGADQTVLRLQQMPAEREQASFQVLKSLHDGFRDAPEVEAQIRQFLERRIHAAQEGARTSGGEWKEHLAGLLDYRTWFDVVTEYRVSGHSNWRVVTKESYAKDSGGGKVVTLLQPLLATLVALYGDGDAPRPLWLDEAFEGVDPSNRSSMLDLLREFSLDFLLVAPTPLVASTSVDVAAVWSVTRAPAPIPGVDLSAMLWAGNSWRHVEFAAPHWDAQLAAARAGTTDGQPDLFDEPPGDRESEASSGPGIESSQERP